MSRERYKLKKENSVNIFTGEPTVKYVCHNCHRAWNENHGYCPTCSSTLFSNNTGNVTKVKIMEVDNNELED